MAGVERGSTMLHKMMDLNALDANLFSSEALGRAVYHTFLRTLLTWWTILDDEFKPFDFKPSVFGNRNISKPCGNSHRFGHPAHTTPQDIWKFCQASWDQNPKYPGLYVKLVGDVGDVGAHGCSSFVHPPLIENHWFWAIASLKSPVYLCGLYSSQLCPPIISHHKFYCSKPLHVSALLHSLWVSCNLIPKELFVQ